MNFFHYYADLIDAPVFDIYELYASLSYNDMSENYFFDFINDIHICFITLFERDYDNFFKVYIKERFEESHSLLMLQSHINLTPDI